MDDIWRNIILVLKLIVDYKHQGYRQNTHEQPAFGEEAVFRTKKILTEDGQYLNVLPLAQKYSTL
jgi:hypothetical protein